MSKKLELIGIKFGRLTVESFAYSYKGSSFWKCKCDCGEDVIIKGSYLTSKTKPTKSCGCLVKDTCINNLPTHRCITHNMTGTKFYNVWNSMIMRCTNPNSTSYKSYGGRGIRVSEKWRKFEGFYDDMFSTYKEGLSIDRIDVDGDYKLTNCKWSNKTEQANNRRSNHYIIFNNSKYTLSELSKKFNVPYDRLKQRLRKGWSIEKAIKEPRRGENYGIKL